MTDLPPNPLPTKEGENFQPRTQTITLRIFGALCLFAFIVSACTASNPSPVTSHQSPVASLQSATLASVLPTNTPATPTPAPLIFDGKHAYDEYLLAQMNFGIRPAGSKPLRATGDYIIAELKKQGWQVETQEFDFRGVPIRNVIGKYGTGRGPLIIVGAHYDTRPRAEMDKENPDAPVPGANDGASGVAALLELARVLDKAKLKNEIWLAFFDAEDNGGLSACDLRVAPQQQPNALCDTNKWGWSIGAQYTAEHLSRDVRATKPAAVIILDMIGDADQNLYYEQNSDPELQEQLWNIAAELGYRQWFIPEFRWSMTDDHTPFLQKGIRAVDIIDFDYPPWHTTQDTADKVSAASLERVGRVMEVWLEGQ